jgi:hypothetical protein
MSEANFINQDYGYRVQSGSPEIKKVKVKKWGSQPSETVFYDAEYGLDPKYYETILVSGFALGGGFVAKTKQEAIDWGILDSAEKFAHYEKYAQKFKQILLDINNLKKKLYEDEV